MAGFEPASFFRLGRLSRPLIYTITKQAKSLQVDYSHNTIKNQLFLAYATGFEPVTIRLEGGCSIQLSYAQSEA